MGTLIDRVQIILKGDPNAPSLSFKAETPVDNPNMPGFPKWFEALATSGAIGIVTNGKAPAIELSSRPGEIGFDGDFVVYLADMTSRILSAQQCGIDPEYTSIWVP